MGILDDGYYQPTSPAPAKAPEQALPSLRGAPTTKVDPVVGELEERAALPLRNVGLEIGGALGLELPEQTAWNQMKAGEKAVSVAKAIPGMAWRTLKNLPRETATAPTRYALTVSDTWSDVAAGKRPTFQSLATKPAHEVPWLGAVPTYYQSYEQARQTGLGPKAALLVTSNIALGDITIGASLAEGVQGAFRPRAKTTAGLPLLDTEQIKSVIKTEGNISRAARRAPDSPNEYYSVPQDVAKKHGGSSADTFIKVSPTGVEGSLEVSIVKTRGSFLPNSKTYRGDFGPETKLESTIVKAKPVGSPAASTARAGALASVPPKPLKGFEKAPITSAQVEHLAGIVTENGIDERIAGIIIRSVTGKAAAGELTQAEYVTAAQSLAGIGKSKQFVGTKPAVGLASQWLSPQRHFTRGIENRGGAPVYSKVYVPMEDAFQAKRVFTDGVDERLSQIYGKYANPSFAEERRLIREATEGRTDVIENNPQLSSATKAELMKIVDDRRAVYDEMGPVFGIGEEYFLENYSPRIQDLGGVYQIYKEGTDIPGEFSPFFEKKRAGSLNVMVDDALALDQIYVRAGANKLYLNPALKAANETIDTLEPTLKGSMKSYVQEKLGYAGRTEQYLEEVGTEMFGKLGIKAPSDLGRQAAQVVMNTTYSGALGGRLYPAVRNTFQAFNSYIRQGPKFFGEAVTKAVTQAGIKELRDRGLLVKLGVPSGTDLAQEATLAGAAKSRYARLTQASLKGQEISDAFSRATTFWQGKYQWDDAFARYKSGKLTYEQLERDLDFKALDPLDQNIIREDLVAGKADKAFNHYIREVIDETQFPFRRGASFRAGYGLAGKVGFQFTQWPIEQAHMLGRWLKTGQYDKLIRWHAVSSNLDRTMRDTFGVSTRDDFGLRTVVPGAAPLVKFSQDVYGAFTQLIDGNQEEFEKHKDGLVRTVTALGVPLGVEIRAIRDFKKSYEAGPIGPDGKYPDYSASGKLDRYATFPELWQKLWGFRPAGEVEERDLGRAMRGAKFQQSDAKKKALELMQKSLDENGAFDTESRSYKDAVQLIEENNIRITGNDFDAYYIPYNERLFKQLPASLKAQFAPRVYPQQ